tara:strand:+ start:138 stop:1001 length:864 start_codon:yes stop_codon:yes gene_type:complete
MSRNEGRFEAAEGIPNPEDEGPPAAAVSAPTQFNWSVPTEFVEIPSKGKFYPNGHPLHNLDTIEIKYMTAKEEDILSDRSLLKKGIAVDRALQNLIVNKAIKIDDLLVGDKNALLIAARKTGFGPEYTTRVTCPACGEVDDYSFDLDDLGHNDFEGSMELEEAILTERNTFKFKLPMTGVEVECRMLTGRDESAIAKKTLRKGRKNEESSLLVDTLALMIVSLNGNDDRIQIAQFAHQMPARDARYLRAVSGRVTPNVDMKTEFQCVSCGATADLEVPLTADFFWPR